MGEEAGTSWQWRRPGDEKLAVEGLLRNGEAEAKGDRDHRLNG